MIKKYENEQAVQALDKLIDFLNDNRTRVELVETTSIGKKYIAMRGYDKREVYLTIGYISEIGSFKNEPVFQGLIFHDGKDIQQKINTVTNQLEKGAAESNVKLKMQYYWKRFKKITKESFRCQ